MATRPYTLRVRRAPALLTVAAGIAACANTQNSVDIADSQVDPTHSTAVVFVERQAGGASGDTAHIGARFVQFSGLPADALPDLLGTPHVPGATTGCAERAEATLDAEATHAEARLLDVGTIDVRVGEQALQLEPRRFPDLWNVVSGVIYATVGELTGDSWHFSAPGNAASRMAGFDLDARAPEGLAGLSVADQAFAPGAAISIPRHAFSVRWARGDQDDGFIVTFEPGGATDQASVIACAAHDDGSLEVDANWAERIAGLSGSGTVITAHRVRARSFTHAQSDSAVVVFDLSVRGRGE